VRDFEQSYNAFGSSFGPEQAAAARGKFGRFLSDDGGPFSQFAPGLNSTFKPPKSTNAAEQSAQADAADQRNQQQFGENLNRINNQFGQQAQLGFNSLSQIQAVQQAKEMAEFNAQSAQQGAMFSAISSGMSLLGGIGSSSLFKPKPSTAANPVASMNSATSYYGI
jgi:hypothetical protein